MDSRMTNWARILYIGNDNNIFKYNNMVENILPIFKNYIYTVIRPVS